jgi:hypothetical protein
VHRPGPGTSFGSSIRRGTCLEARLPGQLFHSGSQNSIVPLPPLVPHAASRNAY